MTDSSVLASAYAKHWRSAALLEAVGQGLRIEATQLCLPHINVLYSA